MLHGYSDKIVESIRMRSDGSQNLPKLRLDTYDSPGPLTHGPLQLSILLFRVQEAMNLS